MKRRMLLLLLLTATMVAPRTTAATATQNRIIVRSTLGSSVLSSLCLLQGCTVVQALDGTLNQVFLLTAPLNIDANLLLNALRATPGVLEAELDQVIPLIGGLNQLSSIPSGLSDKAPISYFGTSVWNGYANQPAASIIHVSQAHANFSISGVGIIADIDTGADPNHPALQPFLLPGYDFTRNQEGASELNDFAQPPPSGNPPAAVEVNQSTAAVLDQSTAAVLDGNSQYAAFGHGTMVLGTIHLVSPTSRLLPVKAFRSDGSAYLSDILRGIYYAVQNNANVINMSFDMKTPSQELSEALTYANQLNVICVASAGNDGLQEIVYPASLQPLIMGVASTNNLDQRSTFSNFGNSIVWVAAPGEQIVTTYPFGTYAAASGTSFSAPMVSGAAGLLLELQTSSNQQKASAAIAHAVNIGANMGNGRLDLLQALQAGQGANPGGNPPPPDLGLSLSPSSQTITAGQSASFTISVAPSGGFNQTVTWNCAGAPAESTCTVSPASTLLDGSSNANVTVSVATTSRTSLAGLAAPWNVPPVFNLMSALLVSLCFLAIIEDSSKRSASERRFRIGYGLAMLLAFLCAACGGGTMNTPRPPLQFGTPAGTSSIVVSGTAGSIHHSATIKLTVN